ncbi:MAG: L,D-transpeptidase family protein [Pseudolabrys sp.]
MKVGIRHLVMASALAAGTASPMPAAHAQGLFDFFFRPPPYNERWDHGRPPRGRGYGRPGYGRPGYGEPRDRYEPQVRVTSPNYRSYTPDMPKRIALDKVCRFKLASNDNPDSVTPESSFGAACAATPTLTLRVLPQVGAALNDYYSKHPRFLWIHDGAVDDKARAAMAALALSGRYGLDPADYRVALPAAGNSAADNNGATNNSNGSDAHLQATMRFELTLSAKMLTYVLDATRGRVDPDRMSDYYDLPRKKVDLTAALGAIAKTQDVVKYLDSRNPDNPQFRALAAALAKARAAAPKETVTIPPRTFIRPGASDPALPQVIAAIKQSGSAALKQQHAATLSAYDGGDVYGPELVALVRDFQREKGLGADGVIGPNTIAAMRQATPADRIEKLKLAMERMRWLPRHFGTRYVLLNEPAYTVTFVRGDQPPVTMRAIVGKPNHQTYFFTDTIESVEFNPYWNVPRSIVVNEMLPRLYNDPYYLDQQGYQVTDTRGQQISSADVDWGAYAQRRVSVDVRQPPGPRNALGVLKIEFPNRQAIYMHDTPEKQLFKHQRLAFSHGCVRLEQPRVMAAALLGKPVSYVDRQIATGNNFSEPVGGIIPVYLT